MTKPHWLDRPENHRKLWIGFIVVLACTVLAEFLWPIHGHFEIESITGFNALYGFGACAAMVAFAKLLGLWLKRSDTFYVSEDSESTSSADNAKGVAHE
jgi:hypothetical protein